jgi:outer membrane protein assembly factor BamB
MLAVWGSAAAASPASWAHFGSDAAFTAYNPVESAIGAANVNTLERKWGIGCDDGYFSVMSRSPAIRDGVLYVSSAGSKLTAYQARTGQKLWQFGNGNYAWAPQPTVAEDGTVFYLEGSYPTHLYAVNGQTGAQVWEAELAFDLGYNDTAVVTVDEARGLVYLVESPFIGDGKLYALHKQTGSVAWVLKRDTDGVGFKGDYVLQHGPELYAIADAPMPGYPSHGDHLLKINVISRTIVLKYNRPAPENYYDIDHHLLCGNRLIASFNYRSDTTKLIVAYDPLSPTIAWQKPVSSTLSTLACDPVKQRLYVPDKSWLYALDATTGAEVWKYTGLADIYNPSVANGIIYFLSNTNMYAIDADTRTQLLRYPLGYAAYETTQVAVADGLLYFSGNGGTCDLFALGLPGPKVYLPLIKR